jgi:hypothetical protein
MRALGVEHAMLAVRAAYENADKFRAMTQRGKQNGKIHYNAGSKRLIPYQRGTHIEFLTRRD